MFKYKAKTAFTYNIQGVVHCRKVRMKQNMDKRGAILLLVVFDLNH